MSPPLRVPLHEQLEKAHEWFKKCFPRVDVVVEHPCPVFEVSEDSTELRNPKVWCTWFWNPGRITASRYHGRLSVSITGSPRHLVLSLLSAFSVVRVNETPNQIAWCKRNRNPNKDLPSHFTTSPQRSLCASLVLARSEASLQPSSPMNARFEIQRAP